MSKVAEKTTITIKASPHVPIYAAFGFLGHSVSAILEKGAIGVRGNLIASSPRWLALGCIVIHYAKNMGKGVFCEK